MSRGRGSELTEPGGLCSVTGMFPLRAIGMLGWLAVCLPGVGRAQDGGLESVVRFLSPELRQIERRLIELADEVEPLPELRKRTWGSRFGHHSGVLASESEPNGVQFDLKRAYPVDTIVLVPVNLSYQGKSGEGYGFPKRFTVEVADNPAMAGAVTVVDCSSADVANPGRYPLTWKFPPIEARYIKLTSLKHAKDGQGFFWAMEEVMMLSGELDVGKFSDKTASSEMDLFPQWALPRLTDGQSALGMPVDVTAPSPSKGYLSADGMDEFEPKWVGLDLEQERVIQQLNLLPLESDDYEVVGGRGFPRRFKLELALDPGFENVVWTYAVDGYPLGYPAGCAIAIQVPDVRARYVRLTMHAMWKRDEDFRFGLAEMQVYSGGANVALGKPVSALDRSNKPPESGWAPEFLVDGFTTRYRLIGWGDYLDLVGRRRQLEIERVALIDQAARKLTTGRRLVLSSGLAVMVALITGWIWAVARGKVLRLREVSRLRDQIARDLHDDIGSNLGGIVLLSEHGSQHSPDPESKRDFEAIRQAAEDSSVAMRDIVWLIQREPVGLKDLVTRMRQSLRVILTHLEVVMLVEPAAFEDRPVGLLFRRHVFLAFKEVLNNVRKHAQAGRVEVRVDIEASCLRFRVRDEGVGFDPETAGASGYGLGNLKRRASRVGGKIQINSAPGKGTEVVFEAPFSN